MPDRIPNTGEGKAKVMTPVTYTLDKTLGTGEELWINIVGDAGSAPGNDPLAGVVDMTANGGDGHALPINAATPVGGSTLDLWSPEQTSAPTPDGKTHSGKIKLAVEDGGKVVSSSAGFSVAAIPVTITMTKPLAIQGTVPPPTMPPTPTRIKTTRSTTSGYAPGGSRP
jgi:hypothetical protein